MLPEVKSRNHAPKPNVPNKPPGLLRVMQTKTAAPNQRPNAVRPFSPPATGLPRHASVKSAVIQRAEDKKGPADVPIRRMRDRLIALKSPQISPTGFFRSPGLSIRAMADALFASFLGLGLGYELGVNMAGLVLGNYPEAKGLPPGGRMRENFGGNCMALASAFSTILDEADILNQVKEVRRQQAGRAFVVRCPNFIDTEVRGHIYQGSGLWASHYLFTNHSAVWVPAVSLYYDPMAGATYHNLAPMIAMELDAVGGDGNVWRGMYLGREYTLTRRLDLAPCAGQLSRYDMALVPPPAPPPPPAAAHAPPSAASLPTGPPSGSGGGGSVKNGH